MWYHNATIKHSMSPPKQPTYDLLLIQKKVGRRFERVITGTAADGARALGLAEEQIIECVLSLDSSMFFKTMPAEQCPGLWQDVYRAPYQGQLIYVKLQVSTQGKAVIVSFKRKQ